MNLDDRLNSAVRSVPAGAWAVGVSGGADSVALLSLLRQRGDLSLHVVHLDHQTRGEASTGDARFVAELAAKWDLPCTVMKRDQIEPRLDSLPGNPSAKYRLLRLELYRRVIELHRLHGVILAHHADDQAETVLHRLLRSSSYLGLAGMCERTEVNGVTILRPLLSVSRAELRQYLTEQNLSWREDASNQSDQYLRNRLRQILAGYPAISASLLDVSAACADLRRWTRQSAPVLGERIRLGEISGVPQILAEESARRWLADRGVPPELIDAGAVERLLTMCMDAAAPAKWEFPGGVCVRRRAGVISANE